AMSIAETEGFTKVITDVKSGRILGVHIVGPSASDLISEAALAVEMVATAEDMALTIHPHPTLGEALMEASAASLGHAIHMMNRCAWNSLHFRHQTQSFCQLLGVNRSADEPVCPPDFSGMIPTGERDEGWRLRDGCSPSRVGT